MERLRLKSAHRIVVKVGTSTLAYPNGKLNLRRLEAIARVISDLCNQGKEMILVTSGAIGVGCEILGFTERPADMPSKQAAAAAGQGELMHVYSRAFHDYGRGVAQILLTRDVTDCAERRANVTNTFSALLSKGIVPVVNENDCVSVDEIRFGDNDTLSAIVAALCDAELLVILTDTDGFYDDNVKINPNAKRFDVVKEITPEMERMAGGTVSKHGTGGMVTKLHAAAIATEKGIDTIIGSGSDPEIIYDFLEAKAAGTLFCGKERV